MLGFHLFLYKLWVQHYIKLGRVVAHSMSLYGRAEFLSYAVYVFDKLSELHEVGAVGTNAGINIVVMSVCKDSVRVTWMQQGEKLKKLEDEKGIIMRYGIFDRAIEVEEEKHGDFLRLDHVDGYLELSARQRYILLTAVAMWDANFYVKVDDDVHVNIATLRATLARHRSKSRVYIGYHEPEYWKFGDEGNKYFRHATGKLMSSVTCHLFLDELNFVSGKLTKNFQFFTIIVQASVLYYAGCIFQIAKFPPASGVL